MLMLQYIPFVFSVRRALDAIATVVKMMDPKNIMHATVEGAKLSNAPCRMNSAMALDFGRIFVLDDGDEFT